MFSVVHNIFMSSMWNWLHVNYLVLKIGWFLDFWKACASLT